MNEVTRTIQGRRTIRKFKGGSLPGATLETIFEAGRWAQSFNNAQPWRFIVVKREETRRRLSEEAGKSLYYKGILETPVTIVVCVDPQEEPTHWIEAGSIGHQNMALAAHSLGLGSSWVAILNTASEEPIKRLLSIPKHVRVLSLMPVGFPNEEPRGSRRPLDHTVYHERYGTRESSR